MNYKEEIKKLQARVDELERKSGGVEKPQHKKITLEEFLQGRNPVAINCDTKEKLEELSKGFKELGLNDFGETLLRSTWIDEKRTCCVKCLKFATKEECEGLEIPVFEFDEVILQSEPEPKPMNKPRWTFTEDEKTILRNVDKGYKWLARDKDNKLWIYKDVKPKKDRNIWENHACYNVFLFSNFQCINWSDDEPCEFRKYI